MAVYAVGVGPGSPECVTGEARRIIEGCDVVAGHGYTLGTIRHLVAGKDVREVTMATQEDEFRRIRGELGDGTLVVPFTGDVSFSESEVVDRLAEIFGRVELVPGVSAVQVAAARAGVPLDKARVITMHVTGPIEGRKLELLKALADGIPVILVPRPWPSRPDKHFMPSEIAAWLRGRGLDTGRIPARVYEALTTPGESCFAGTAAELEGREFSDMSVLVLGRAEPDSYANYRWQWASGGARDGVELGVRAGEQEQQGGPDLCQGGGRVAPQAGPPHRGTR